MTPASTPWPLPFWIAHRGAGRLAPENTLAAFRAGAGFGYRAFECDLKLSRDGVPFLLHDDDLDRTSNGRGPARALDWSQLSRLDAGGWHSLHHAGEPIASLEGIAAFLIANQLALNIELKPNPGQARETGEVLGREVTRLWAGQRLRPVFSSFQPEALEGVRTSAPDERRALLLDKHRDSWLEEAKALGCCAAITNYRLMDRARIEAIHAAGMRALVYTVNDEATAARLRSEGLDGLITDAVDRLDPAR
ncbi:glycerophosphodiester phosphodiesterase [Roseateles sp. DB2]|uniref:glycerophosphodiester phosphodiesterase n=1 Tax=Roseateles sp. DB2 TaxID=3453717 RepID=UPI003EEA54ED